MLSYYNDADSTRSFSAIMRHTTSLQWIFDIIKRYFDINTSGINFLNLPKLMYDARSMHPMGFYQKHHAHILQNTAHKMEVIHWNNARE